MPRAKVSRDLWLRNPGLENKDILVMLAFSNPGGDWPTQVYRKHWGESPANSTDERGAVQVHITRRLKHYIDHAQLFNCFLPGDREYQHILDYHTHGMNQQEKVQKQFDLKRGSGVYRLNAFRYYTSVFPFIVETLSEDELQVFDDVAALAEPYYAWGGYVVFQNIVNAFPNAFARVMKGEEAVKQTDKEYEGAEDLTLMLQNFVEDTAELNKQLEEDRKKHPKLAEWGELAYETFANPNKIQPKLQVYNEVSDLLDNKKFTDRLNKETHINDLVSVVELKRGRNAYYQFNKLVQEYLRIQFKRIKTKKDRKDTKAEYLAEKDKALDRLRNTPVT